MQPASGPRREANRSPSTFEALERRQLLSAAIQHVIDISIDGFRPDGVTVLGPGQLPNFYRLRRQGSFTDNARADHDFTNTSPNNMSIITGRPVLGAAGHGWVNNDDVLPPGTVHTNKGSYVASVFDVVHDNGLRTGSFVDKGKFQLYDYSWDADTAPFQGGAPDTTGEDNGRDKIDVNPTLNSGSGNITDALLAAETANPLSYAFLHYTETDFIGHRDGWMTTNYLSAVKNLDRQLGRIFAFVDGNAAFKGTTAIILTSEHGGTGFAHADATDPANYTVPLYLWGPGIAPGGAL
jgi:predicted AlkP superfamily pyrophosphatase or phosphodiesterase